MREFLFNHALELAVPESKVAVATFIITRVSQQFNTEIEYTKIKEPGADCYQFSIVAVGNQYAQIYFRMGELFHFHKLFKP